MKTLPPSLPRREVATLVLLAGLTGCEPKVPTPVAEPTAPLPETLVSRTQADAAEAERRAALATEQARKARESLQQATSAAAASRP